MSFCLSSAGPALAAPDLVKLTDFNNSNPLVNPQPQAANDSPVLIDGKLWFTCEKGGENGAGSLSYFDLLSEETSVVLSMDNLTGQTPTSTPTVDGELLYVTTTGSAAGSIYSTLFQYNRVTENYQGLLWEATGGSSPHARTPRGGVTIIDRGAAGKDLYFTTYAGGPSNTGTIQRYQTNTGETTQVHLFPNSPGGKFPYKGFTAVGTKLYFTTFNGGNGLGTLGVLDATIRGGETVTTLAAMPTTTESYAQLPSHNPYYRAEDNCLYFTTVGSNTQPGALMKYDLNTDVLSYVHKIAGGPTSGHFPEGNKCYGEVAEWDKCLYYTTIGGGANVPTGTGVGGTINRYDLRTGQHEVLFSLDAGTNDGFGGEIRGGPVFNGSGIEPAFYLITKQGGTRDHGTILRLDLDPAGPSSTYENWLALHPSLTGPDRTPTADPDGDGMNNATEFIFGTSPTSHTGDPGHRNAITPEGMELRWTARADESVFYQVMTSATLGDPTSPWQPVPVAAEVLTTPDIPIAAGYERRRVVIPTGAETKVFFRIEAAFNPTAVP